MSNTDFDEILRRLKNRLKTWLEIPELKEIKKWEKKAEGLHRDLKYWHGIFRSFSVIPCAYCKKQMRVYPYGGAYYHIEDNKKVHAACYDKYLKAKKD